MLETIYEVDEDCLRDEETTKSAKEQSRLSVYMCWCMITGCFLILAFIIFISLNPQYLLNPSTNKHTRNVINTSLHSNEKFELSADIINYLGIFAQEVNKPVDLQVNPIGFLTSSVSNSPSSRSERLKRHGILWVYGHVNYPLPCRTNATCKENLRTKLTTSFDDLANLMKTVGSNSYRNRPIRLDWCALLENVTSATFVSLVSIETVNQNASDTLIPFDLLLCGGLDSTALRSKTLDDLILQEGAVFINPHSNVISGEDDALINGTHIESIQSEEISDRDRTQCTSSQQRETAHCSNDTDTQYPPNSF